MEEVVLVGHNGEIFYEGEDDRFEIAYAVEEYLSFLSNEEIIDLYAFNLQEEVLRCKNEALTCQDKYTWAEAEKIDMTEFDKLGEHHDSFTGRMMDFYYDIYNLFLVD